MPRSAGSAHSPGGPPERRPQLRARSLPSLRVRIAALVLAVATSLLTLSAAQESVVTDVPSLPIEQFTLPNGLRVILSRDTRLPMVAVNLWYHVGPVNEDAGRTGFAHLFEHMMFQGSKHVPPDAHFRLLEAAGASSINGTTDYDRTNYFETVPASELELALWLESDRMGYLLEQIDTEMLTNQQDVVRNERRQSVENRPYGLAEEALVQSLFPAGHPYHGNVIGSHADIQAARLDDVRRFFRQYYAPGNASLAIVGDFDPAATRALVGKYFGSLRRGPDVPAPSAPRPVVTEPIRRVVPDRVELPRVYFAWITSPIFTPGDAEATVAASILGGGRSSRLYRALVYERQIAQNVTVRQESLQLGSMFQIQVTGRPGTTAQALEAAVREQLAAFRAEEPTRQDVAQAVTTIETGIITRLERLGGFGGVADRLNMYAHYLGTPDYLAQDIQRYRAVTPAAVAAFVRAQLRPEAVAVVHAVPDAPGQGAAADRPAAAVPPAAQGEAPSPAPQDGGPAATNVEGNPEEPWRAQPPRGASPARPSLPVPQSARLANGLTLIVSERPGFPVVAASLVVQAGGEMNPVDRAGLASFVAAMLDEGTASRSATRIADDLAGLGATLDVSSSMDATTVSTRALSRHFGEALDLMADVVVNPAFPAEEVDRQRASRLAQLAQQRSNAGAIADRVMAAALYGRAHPYGYPEAGTEETTRQTTREDLVQFWRRTFVPGRAALVVAGDITLERLRPLAERAFGAWRGDAATALAAPAAPRPTRASVIIVDRPGAPQTQVRVATVGVSRATPDHAPLQVLNATLGGLFSSRINMNLREEHGYTYGASSRFVYRRGPGPFVVGSAVRTDVTAPAVAEVLSEIRDILGSPMTDDELGRSRDAMVRSIPASFETSGGTAASFASIFTYDLGLDYFARYADRVTAVTAEQALAAGLRHLAPDRLVVVAVGDKSRIETGLRALDIGPVEIWTADGVPAN